MSLPDVPDDLGFPSLDWEPEFPKTRPLALSELPLQTRLDRDMDTIAALHPRIAQSIVDFWGTPECMEFMQALILNGDQNGVHRQGFNAAVFAALMDVMALHQRQYAETKRGPDPPLNVRNRGALG